MKSEQDAEAERRKMIQEVQDKVAQADRDLLVKRLPYETDPLFMYLWNRGFGTPNYRSKGLVRFLDRKVAQLVGYDMARRNYHVLTELPERLREHLRMLQASDA